MIGREFKFHDGEKGAALAIRVIAGKEVEKIDTILKDGTVVVHLKIHDSELNLELIKFLADELGIAKKRFDVIAGAEGDDKIVSIINIKPDEIQNLILKKIS
ncbi:MAG: hypothetical protein MUP11_11650 [Anaerolineales bacterium]|nr:hypothetical protein [Anaerolineales bacterium]